MNGTRGRFLAGVCVLGMAAAVAGSARAQTSEVKEKPPMYCYIGNWDIPRAQWADMAKADEADRPILDKAMAGGTLVGYGNDVTMVHTANGGTNDQWWCANSLAGVVNILEQFYQSGSTTTPVLASATKHWDEVYVSRYYNWKTGSTKNGYTHVGRYKLKADAPEDAVESLSKNLVVPLLEKLLADGTIVEYEIDQEAIHTDAPGSFEIVYIAKDAAGLDKVQAAVESAIKTNPLGGSAFGSVTDSSGHRDELLRTNATYK
jgi:hypothetical protein